MAKAAVSWAGALASVTVLLGAVFAAAGLENMLNGFWRAEKSDELMDGFGGLVSASAVPEPPAFGCSGVAGCGAAGGGEAAVALASAGDWEPDAAAAAAAADEPAAGIAATAAVGSGFTGATGWFCCGTPSHGADLAVACEGAAGVVGVGSMLSGVCVAVLPNAELAARVAGVAGAGVAGAGAPTAA